ncbi:MAG: AAA family ATPase, partial [Myxococcota bacterium]
MDQLGVELPESWSELGQLVEKLLCKGRHQRPGYARRLLRTLERSGIVPDAVHDPAREGRAYLHRPDFIGRGRVLQPLVDLLEQGRGGLVMVGGESGVGKTRLAQELIREARRASVRVWLGYCSNVLGAERREDRPLGLFVPILRQIADRCLQQGPAFTAALFRPEDIAILAPYAPYVAQLPMPPGRAVVESLAKLPVDSAQLRLFACLVGVLERMCGSSRVLFVLDDLQWGDELSLGALEFIAKGLEEDSRWLMVGTYRIEELADSALQEMMDECPCQLIEMGRLDREEVALMVEQMLGHAADRSLVDIVVARSGQNPFFVAEYLRALVDHGVLHQDGQGRWTVVDGPDVGPNPWPEPDSIRTLLIQRLERLDVESRQVCQAAAVLGRRMATQTLQTVCPLAHFPFLRALDALIQLQILERDGDQLLFVHDKLREVTYTQMDPELRTAIHRRVAQSLEELESFDPATTALHWSKGSEPERARARYIEAARMDAERWAVGDAKRHLQSALGLVRSCFAL